MKMNYNVKCTNTQRAAKGVLSADTEQVTSSSDLVQALPIPSPDAKPPRRFIQFNQQLPKSEKYRCNRETIGNDKNAKLINKIQ